MKRTIAKLCALLLAALCCLAALTACGNMAVFDTTYTFDYAIVAFPDGSTKTIEIKSWTDYEGEQIQIEATDGTVYLVNSVNCILVSEKD